MTDWEYELHLEGLKDYEEYLNDVANNKIQKQDNEATIDTELTYDFKININDIEDDDKLWPIDGIFEREQTDC